MTTEASKEQEKAGLTPCRDSLGRFKAGRSGNPSGRPVGASYRGLVAARRWAEEKGLPLLMAAAENGDAEAVKFLVTLGIPRQKPVSMPESLPDVAGLSTSAGLVEQARTVLAAALAGELGPDYAVGCMALLAQAVKIEESAELKQRIEALERSLAEHKTV